MPPTEKLFFGVPKRFIEKKPLPVSKGKPSKAHSYFHLFIDSRDHKEINKGFVHCKLCYEQWQPDKPPTMKFYGKGTATGNWMDHLEEAHNLYLRPNKDKNLVKIDALFKAQSDSPLEYYFLLWIALDNLPLSKVEGIGFKLLMKKLGITKVPSRMVLTRRCLPKLFESLRDHIKSMIDNEVTYYTISMDIWTDGFQKIPYLAFLLHYGHEFTQKEILLDIGRLRGNFL